MSLTLIGLGIVTEDKAKDSPMITVYLKELITDIEGLASDYKVEPKSRQRDLSQTPIKSTATAGATLQATWLESTDSQRRTAPDVVRNEQVYIYQYKDVDQYFWRSVKFDPKKRRLEHIVYELGNKTKPLEDLGEPGAHRLTLSSRDGYFELKTSVTNGEPVEFTIRLDLSKGVVSYHDSKGQSHVLDSVNGTLTGKMNTKVTMDCPEGEFTGNMVIGGNLTVKGNSTINGSQTVNSSHTTNGKTNAKGGINTNGCKGC